MIICTSINEEADPQIIHTCSGLTCFFSVTETNTSPTDGSPSSEAVANPAAATAQ